MAGAGLFARCKACASALVTGTHGGIADLQLTSKRKRIRIYTSSKRVDTEFLYEYICAHCGHQGWSRHIDLARKWSAQARRIM